MPGGDHVLVQSRAGVLLGDGLAEGDDSPAGAEVVVEGHPLHAGAALDEREDVRYRAATPLVDRLVVVADDTQVGSELGKPSH